MDANELFTDLKEKVILLNLVDEASTFPTIYSAYTVLSQILSAYYLPQSSLVVMLYSGMPLKTSLLYLHMEVVLL